MTFSRLILVLAALSLSACAITVQPVASGTRPITLDASYTKNILPFGSVVFPKGVYQPTFQDDGGVFYEAPTHLLVNGGLIPGSPFRGGLFIPNDRSAKQECWLEPNPNHRYRLREPVPYH